MRLVKMLTLGLVAVISALFAAENAWGVLPPPSPPANNLLYDILSSSGGGAFTNKGNWGFDFTTTQSYTVKALGLWDDSSNGLGGAHMVGLWRSGDVLLASASVSSASRVVSSANSSGRWLFTDLDTPLVLPPAVYTLAFYNPAGGGADPFFSGRATTYAANSTYNNGRGVNNAGSFARPDTNSGNVSGFYGANVQFVGVPEPGSVVLGSMAFVGLMFVARRHMRSRQAQ